MQLQKLEKQNVSSIIIDLRSNGGGALTEAVSLSGLFIPSGPVVQVRDNNGKVREDSDNDGVVYYKGPLVVLVDRFSASASEDLRRSDAGLWPRADRWRTDLR